MPETPATGNSFYTISLLNTEASNQEKVHQKSQSERNKSKSKQKDKVPSQIHSKRKATRTKKNSVISQVLNSMVVYRYHIIGIASFTKSRRVKSKSKKAPSGGTASLAPKTQLLPQLRKRVREGPVVEGIILKVLIREAQAGDPEEVA